MIRIKRLRNIVHEMDPSLSEDDESFKVAMVLLASGHHDGGPNGQRLAKFTGFPLPLVSVWGRRFRENGIWDGSKVVANWDDPEVGSIEFWMDVACGQGLVERA
jgi:hypothetical protein